MPETKKTEYGITGLVIAGLVSAYIGLLLLFTGCFVLTVACRIRNA